MMNVKCPYCGPRSEVEYSFGGPAHLVRPGPAAKVSDEEWAGYLFMLNNVKGVSAERWCHSHGCGQWFNMLRNTVTHEILNVYKMGESLEDALGTENTMESDNG